VNDDQQLFSSLQLLATVVATSASALPIIVAGPNQETKLPPIIDNNSSNRLQASQTDQPTAITTNSSGNSIITNSTNPLQPINTNQTHLYPNDDNGAPDQQIIPNSGIVKLKAIQELLTLSIDEFVPARVISNMTIFDESGVFASKILKPVYARTKQEEMIKTLAEAEKNVMELLSFLQSNNN
jgi:hypothetical protein